MLSEKAFTSKDREQLLAHPVTAEMACLTEWIAREDAKPDELLTLFVSQMSDGTIQIACSCLRGAADLTCPHALRVIDKFREDPELLAALNKRKHDLDNFRAATLNRRDEGIFPRVY